MVISRPGVRSKEEEGIPLDFNALVRRDSCDLDRRRIQRVKED